MTITAKYCIIVFGVLPLGMAASAVAGGKTPWSLVGAIASIAVTILLLRRLRCPRCGTRVAFSVDPFSSAVFRSAACGVIVIRCSNCGHELNHDG